MNVYFDRAAALFEKYRHDLQSLPESVRDGVTDIRLAVGHRPTLYLGRKPLELPAVAILTAAEMQELIFQLCDYSVYKHVEEIKNGFIAAKGGLRVGICGTAVLAQGGVENITGITSLTVRIPHRIHGASDLLCSKAGPLMGGLLIVGEPSSGKTTILRDLITVLCEKRLAVLDERYELTGGENPLNLHVLCGYPKTAGILQVIRNLGAEMILCDELEKKDLEAVETCAASGVALIATVHGSCDGAVRPLVRELAATGAFEKIVQLAGRDAPGTIRQIWKAGELLENSGSNPHCFCRGSRRIYPHAASWTKN